MARWSSVLVGLTLALGATSAGCVTRTVGVRIEHTAYVANGGNPESRQCVDRCLAEGQRVPWNGDEDAWYEADARVAKCASHCPGVIKVPETTCAQATSAQTTSCAERARKVKIREANPAGIVGVALGGVAMILFTIWFITGHVNVQ